MIGWYTRREASLPCEVSFLNTPQRWKWTLDADWLFFLPMEARKLSAPPASPSPSPSLSLMPSSHCTILARFFTRRQVLINRRQMAEIGGKSVLVPASDNRAVWIIKDAIWGNRRHVADAREIFGMLNIWSCQRFSILLCEWVLTGSDWKIHQRWPTANESARYRAAGSSRRSFFYFLFFLQSEH